MGDLSNARYDAASVFSLYLRECCVGFRGDVNGDGADIDIVDLTFLVDYLFGIPPVLNCLPEADLNGDGASGGGGGGISLGEQTSGSGGVVVANTGIARTSPTAGMTREEIEERTPEDVAPIMADDDIIARQLREAALTEEDPALRERLWEEYRKYKGL